MNTPSECDHGVVFSKTIGHYTVHAGSARVVCVLSSLLRKKLIYPTADPTSLRRNVRAVKVIEGIDPIAIGDEVTFRRTAEGTGMITAVLPRRTRLSRPANMMEGYAFEQVIVANADQVVPVFSAARPQPKWHLLDRYLVSAENAALQVLICITKNDLLSGEDDLEDILRLYRSIGYPVLRLSAFTGQGVGELKDALRGRFSVFVGKSGVGKSTLLNALQPGLGLRTGDVGAGRVGKGKHTTSHLQMFPLDGGGAVVDTPGMREFGLWGIQQGEMPLLFPEMRSFVGCCRFGLDCSHREEPGCAIHQAVVDGAIHPLRYRSLLQMQETP